MFHKSLLEIFCLSLLWGPSFLFIKIAIRDISPLTLVSLRIGLGAFLLFTILKIRKIKIPFTAKLLKHCFVLGIFVNGLPFICFNYSLERIPTSLSALINGTTPLITLLLANLFLEDEKLTRSRALGVLIGIFGFMILFLPRLVGSDFEFDTFGMFLSFIGACCYAIGMVYARKYVTKAPQLVIPTLQLFTSLIYLLPLAFIFESPMDARNASLSAWSAVVGLGVFGTMFAYMLYYRIINLYGATTVSMVTYLLPIFGTILGVVFLNEKIGLEFYLATSFILLGVMVSNGVITLPKRQKLLHS